MTDFYRPREYAEACAGMARNIRGSLADGILGRDADMVITGLIEAGESERSAVAAAEAVAVQLQRINRAARDFEQELRKMADAVALLEARSPRAKTADLAI